MTEDQLRKLHYFLARVGDGYIELSHDKIRGEYLYYKEKARELLWELFPPEVVDKLPTDAPFDDDF